MQICCVGISIGTHMRKNSNDGTDSWRGLFLRMEPSINAYWPSISRRSARPDVRIRRGLCAQLGESFVRALRIVSPLANEPGPLTRRLLQTEAGEVVDHIISRASVGTPVQVGWYDMPAYPLDGVSSAFKWGLEEKQHRQFVWPRKGFIWIGVKAT